MSDFQAQLIDYDERPTLDRLNAIAERAVSERLSGCDATYLELAIRLGAKLGPSTAISQRRVDAVAWSSTTPTEPLRPAP